MPKTLINISNRLPVTIKGDEISKSSGGLVAALEGLPADEYNAKWIGWPGGAVEPDKQPAVECKLIEEHGCTPVFLTAEEAEAHYEGFSNSSVWPLLHGMNNYLRYESAWWDEYRKVNQRFADKALELAGDDDLVWVHDYQLLLVPALLKAARPALRVGFFLHTPFPAYDVFRCHPRRRELIEGILGADLLGFHTFGYVRHVRSAALQLLGGEAAVTRVRRPSGGQATLGAYPIGINAGKFDETLDQPGHAARQEKFRRTFEGKRIVLSVERMDYTKGILHRLEAVNAYLAGLEDRDTIKFIFVSVPSREGVEEYQELREEVESRIGRLNGKYATLHNSPIHFIHGSVEFADLCALYSIADVGLVTPLVDGMNLVAKEFLACQRDRFAPLILGEFAGAAEELPGALLVNPYDTQAVAASIAQALAMPEAERRARGEPMRERVMSWDAQRWAKSFIGDLLAAGGEPPATDEGNARGLEEVSGRIKQMLASGGRVALFLDYDGTLREIVRNPADARPDAALRAFLDALTQREGVETTVISGRVPEHLEDFLRDYPNIGLVAEHGASVRSPGAQAWGHTDAGVNYAWKDELKPVLQGAADATPGSFLEEKRTSLVWHYRRADAEFGAWRARQLVEELSAVTTSAPVVVRGGKKIIEIVSTQVDKGSAVRRLLAGREDNVFALCIGDDETDESMFALEAENVGGIKVGAGATRAKLRLADPAAVRKFLSEAIRSNQTEP